LIRKRPARYEKSPIQLPTQTDYHTGWRRYIGCLKLQVSFCKRAIDDMMRVSFRKRAIDSRTFWWKMTYKERHPLRLRHLVTASAADFHAAATPCVCVCTDVYIHIYLYLHKYTHTYTNIHIYVCMYVYVCLFPSHTPS